MLTKEECLKAVNTLEFTSYDINSEVNSALLQQLIEEHFDNSMDFKGFKLHADSTLKTFKKDELIDYIHMIYRNWQGTDLSCENVIRYNYQLADEIEKQIKRIKELELKEKQWIETEKDYRDEIKELKSNPPLKFEELETEKWYWDNKWKEYFEIYDIDDEEKVLIVYDCYTKDFEENRFYRKQVEECKI